MDLTLCPFFLPHPNCVLFIAAVYAQVYEYGHINYVGWNTMFYPQESCINSNVVYFSDKKLDSFGILANVFRTHSQNIPRM